MGGREPPLHMHVLAAKPIYTFPRGCLGGEMSGLTARQRTALPVGALGARQSRREPGLGARAVLQGAGSAQAGSAPRWFHPACSSLKAPGRTWSKASGFSGLALTAGSAPVA